MLLQEFIHHHRQRDTLPYPALAHAHLSRNRYSHCTCMLLRRPRGPTLLERVTTAAAAEHRSLVRCCAIHHRVAWCCSMLQHHATLWWIAQQRTRLRCSAAAAVVTRSRSVGPRGRRSSMHVQWEYLFRERCACARAGYGRVSRCLW